MFPTPEAARLFLEDLRWPHGTLCPFCRQPNRITPRPAGFYRCNRCAEDFTVRTKTPFARSHIPLHKWFYAIRLITTTGEQLSSKQLATELAITQKSASFMLRRLHAGFDLQAGTLHDILHSHPEFRLAEPN